MEQDYSYPSVYFAYFYFLLMLVGAVFFFLRSFKDGYWDERGELVKMQMLKDEENSDKEA